MSSTSGGERCLICYSEIAQFSEEGSGNLVSRDLQVVFILRQLFEIPKERLEEYLVEGEGPGGWGIRLCGRCRKAVDNCRGLYKQMLRTTRTFKRAREEVVEILRGSECIKRSLEGMGGVPLVRGRRIQEETREFVCAYDYGRTEEEVSFKEGDSQAETMIIERLAAEKRERDSMMISKPKRSRAVNSEGFGFCNLHLYKDSTGKRFQCPICCQIFSHLSKMKFHTIRIHMDHLFESEKLPGVTSDKFRYYCKSLIENTTPEGVNISMESTKINSCTHCGKGFTDRRYLHCHWLQHHYDVLARRLQDLQRNPDQACSSSSSSAPPTMTKHTVVRKPIISCSQCMKNFAEISELKIHVAVSHTELWFPPAKFNPGNLISLEKFRTCCQSLFRNEKYKMVGNESFGCPFCEKTYISKRNVYVHMLDNHHNIMEVKLMEVLKVVQAFPPSSFSPQLGKNLKVAEPRQVSPSISKKGTGGGGSGPILSIPRMKRKDNMREPTFICVDCGSKFGYSSVLTRHRKFNCPVRRSLGLTVIDNQQDDLEVIRPCTSSTISYSEMPIVPATPIIQESTSILEEAPRFPSSTVNQGGCGVNFSLSDFDQSGTMEVTTEPVVLFKCDSNDDDIEVILDEGDPLFQFNS